METMWKIVGLLLVALSVPFPVILSAQEGVSPAISDLKVDPQAGPPGTIYTITIRTTDPQGPEDIVKILYQIREKIEAIEVPINDDGTDGDVASGDGIYTGRSVVPETAARRTHRFEVFVEDKERHRSNILEYRFTVLEQIET